MFEQRIKQMYEQLEKIKQMVVATSAYDVVTARTLSTIFHQGKLYFQTDIDFITVKQLKENHKIALCSHHIQIEGEAKILGPTLQQEILAELYKEKHHSSFHKYSHLPNTYMIEVFISKITTWEYRDGKVPYQCWYDIRDKVYKEQPYL